MELKDNRGRQAVAVLNDASQLSTLASLIHNMKYKRAHSISLFSFLPKSTNSIISLPTYIILSPLVPLQQLMLQKYHSFSMFPNTNPTFSWFTFVLVVISALKQGVVVVNGEPLVPCFFIFGDSLLDNGNNNLLETTAKANYPPYGIDFPQGATGRFSNGRTTTDIIAEKLGFEKYIPPYATAKGEDILKGVNYASGSAGIRDETGKHAGDNISFNKQLRHHLTTVLNIAELLGDMSLAADLLSKCLYWVGMGNNDYINNYFLPQYYNTSRLYSPQKYAKVLIKEYSKQIMSLYVLGARKMMLNAVGEIGCTPNAIAFYGNNTTSCVEYMNDAGKMFNTRLKLLVRKLNRVLHDAEFIFGNTIPVNDMDFEVLNSSCCDTIQNMTCIPNGSVCPNRTAYVFWDSYHTTEAYNLIAATRSYKTVFPAEIDLKDTADTGFAQL